MLVWWKQHEAKRRKVGDQVKCYHEAVKPTELLDMHKQPQKKKKLTSAIRDLRQRSIKSWSKYHHSVIFLMLSYPCIIALHVSHQHLYPCQCNVHCSASGNQPLSPPHHYYITLTTTGWWFFFPLSIQLVHVALEQWHHTHGGFSVWTRWSLHRVHTYTKKNI